MSRARALVLALALGILPLSCSAIPGGDETMRPPGTFASPSPLPRTYPWHTDILAATFWVGEVLDPDAPDGSQRVSTYDSRWMERYGGCDGVWIDQQCQTEQRYEEDGWWPRHVEPRMNPFYLDLPFDDVNDDSAFAMRGDVIPWAVDPGYAEHVGDRSFSLMKNRWVQLRHSGRTCYGQIADAGPGVYDDAGYVFGIDDRRPVSRAFRGAGLDVSPALNGCLDLAGLDQLISRVDWRFVEAEDVPDGPWTRIVDDDPWVR
ncbi:hypothetical protein D9V41_09445 [Aeromicrobium phragmitis]|uniref:Uncharacterized protein n=2 Tax=Aeromicrobium phragmitis TaxID=2478914 RepID=A0A3L8PK50_9ACTN|nr:hypothetical protein D9V41_09445 [Aeromicrobium phragmitis]